MYENRLGPTVPVKDQPFPLAGGAFFRSYSVFTDLPSLLGIHLHFGEQLAQNLGIPIIYASILSSLSTLLLTNRLRLPRISTLLASPSAYNYHCAQSDSSPSIRFWQILAKNSISFTMETPMDANVLAQEYVKQVRSIEYISRLRLTPHLRYSRKT